MIPLRETSLGRGRARMVRTLVVVNVLVFLLGLLLGPRHEALWYRFGIVPAYWVLAEPGDWLRLPWLVLTLVTSQFLHGGLLHVAANMLYLWIFGGAIEDRLGPRRFTVLYLGSGVVGGLVQLISHPDSSVALIGASAAVAGILGAYFLVFPFARVVMFLPMPFYLKRVELPAFMFLGIWFLLHWLQGVASIGEVTGLGGTAWWVHVGGFVTGLVFVVAGRVRRHYF